MTIWEAFDAHRARRQEERDAAAALDVDPPTGPPLSAMPAPLVVWAAALNRTVEEVTRR